MTGLPARTFSLRDRGLVREGMAAGLVMFHPARAEDKATCAKPHQSTCAKPHQNSQNSQGFDLVLVNGKMAVDDGNLTDARPGQTLRHR